MSRVRIAVIGLGGISQSVHVPLVLRNGDKVELVALADLSADRVAALARRWGVPPQCAFTSVDDLVAAVAAGTLRLDAAILATTGAHGADVARLVTAGIRVLAEKPLSYSLAELEALRADAGRAGIDLRDFLRVGYMKEFDAASRQARDLLASVKLRAVGVEVMHPLDGSQLAFAHLMAPPTDVAPRALAAASEHTDRVVDDAIGTDTDPTTRALYTNVIMGSIVHDIGLLRMLVGGLGEVRHAEHWGERMPGSLHFRGRLAASETPWSLDWHYIDKYPDYRETVTFHHEGGTIELVFGVPYVLNLPTILRVIEPQPGLGARVSESRWMQQEAFDNELHALVGLVRGERPEGPGVDESVADVRVGQRMLAAVAASKQLAVAPSSEVGRATHPSPR